MKRFDGDPEMKRRVMLTGSSVSRGVNVNWVPSLKLILFKYVDCVVIICKDTLKLDCQHSCCPCWLFCVEGHSGEHR